MNAADERTFVLRTVQERGIGFVRLWFTDVLGQLKSFAIPAEELEEALEEGVGFDGSAVAGFARVQESDMLARPDTSTFQILPWRPDAPGVARMYCDVYRPDGEPFRGDPRGVLRRVMARASEIGLLVLRRSRARVLPLRGCLDTDTARRRIVLRPHPPRRRE